MSQSRKLSENRTNTVINTISSKQENECVLAMNTTIEMLKEKYPNIHLFYTKKIMITEIIDKLKQYYSDEEFFYENDSSFITPDGGFLFMVSSDGTLKPILISEVKNQGTNKRRMANGLPKQAKGNAIERLGKNVIALKRFTEPDGIFPFVCFGYGCDFEKGSTILDRVYSIAGFNELNTINLDWGSYFFREEKWLVEDMINVFFTVADNSIKYYLEKEAQN